MCYYCSCRFLWCFSIYFGCYIKPLTHSPKISKGTARFRHRAFLSWIPLANQPQRRRSTMEETWGWSWGDLVWSWGGLGLAWGISGCSSGGFGAAWKNVVSALGRSLRWTPFGAYFVTSSGRAYEGILSLLLVCPEEALEVTVSSGVGCKNCAKCTSRGSPLAKNYSVRGRLRRKKT